MIFLLFILASNHILIYGSVLSDDEIGWWDGIANHIPSLWYAEEMQAPNDNDQEIDNSVKLMELFPTLKKKLESSNEEEQEEAKEFIRKMNTEIKERKRYTQILWKGVKTIIDMGRWKSNQRRSNEENVNIFWKMYQGLINLYNWIFGIETDDDKKDKHEDGEKNKHEKSSTELTKHSAQSPDLKTGLKDDLDHFNGNAQEFIDGQKKSDSHSSTKDEHPTSFDPKSGKCLF